MPLILTCGYPCSGKSSVVERLAQSLRSLQYDTLVVPEPALRETPCSIGGSVKDVRSEIYSDSNKERELRGLHKSEVERALTSCAEVTRKGTMSSKLVVIMDAPNYIKGYRYELYCMAKSLKHQHAVLLCDTPVEKCMQWNDTISRYPKELISDMIARFEPPQASSRWDSPLLIFEPDSWPCVEKIDCSSIITELNALVFNVDRSTIKPNRSTLPAVMSPDGFLQQLEYVSQLVVEHILSNQSAGAHTVGLPESLRSSCTTDVQLRLSGRERPFTLADLMRAKRSYISLQRAKLTDSPRLPDAPNLASSFMRFLASSSNNPLHFDKCD